MLLKVSLKVERKAVKAKVAPLIKKPKAQVLISLLTGLLIVS